jgi:hypothetical protein
MYMDRKQDDIFRELAVRYAKQYGIQLQREADALNAQETPHASISRTINRRIAMHRRRRYVTACGTLAACAALFFVLRLALPHSIVSPPPHGTPIPAAVIPLTFSLPAEFSVADVEQDAGQTIYFLEHNLRDDVVLTLERPELPPVWDNFERHELNGETVYLLAQDSFKLLSFEREGVLHTLSSRYDINTLVGFVKNI